MRKNLYAYQNILSLLSSVTYQQQPILRRKMARATLINIKNQLPVIVKHLVVRKTQIYIRHLSTTLKFCSPLMVIVHVTLPKDMELNR